MKTLCARTYDLCERKQLVKTICIFSCENCTSYVLGTIAGNKEGESGRYASKHRNSAQVTVLHRHLLVAIVMVIVLAGYWLFPS